MIVPVRRSSQSTNEWLALVDALLTSISAVCAIAAYVAITRKQIRAHRNLMGGAFAASSLFLLTFAMRFVQYGFKELEGEGAVRAMYLAVFFSHEPLAVVSVPLVVCALVLALRGSWAAHRHVARIALPIWLFACVTGVLIYLMLYVI
jgi:putative membrane protein